MAEVIGVRFKNGGKVYYFDPVGIKAAPGQQVIVETARGVECGEVALGNKTVGEEEVVAPLKPIIRLATQKDLDTLEENRRREQEAFSLCQEKIEKHKLDMKLVDVEYTFDNNKILFYFTADGRVDFRDLVKDLAGGVPHQDRTAADRRAGRVQNAGGLGDLRPAVLLLLLPGGFPACVHQNGQGAEPVFKSHQDLRHLRPADVLFEV